MIITKKYVPRRTFLRGMMGVGIALPMLDCMVPALTAQSKTAANPRLRFGAIYTPNGTVASRWLPSATGKNFEFTDPIKPYEPFRDQMTVVSGLYRKTPGVHLEASAVWLNGAPPEPGVLHEEITVDQRIATKTGQETIFPSLELATQDLSQTQAVCGSGLSCAYMGTISWRTANTPLPMEINPRVIFERMFGDSGTADERVARLKYRMSILDSVAQDTSKLKGLLGAEDRRHLEDYLESLREIERRIQNAEGVAKTNLNLEVPDAPAGVPASYDEHVKLLFDLQFLAFQADMTRVFTFMLAIEGSDQPYPWIGVPLGHHVASHHGNDPQGMEKVVKINAYHASLVAYFVERLKNARDGDGTLLDHSLLLVGSGMGEGNVHDRYGLPLCVIGGNGFGVQGGRHIAHAKGTPMPNLLLSILDRFDIHLDRLADSTGRVDLA